MLDGLDAGVIIECRYAHNDVWLGWALGDEVRPTYRAEMSELSLRRFKCRQLVFAILPAEVLPHHPSR